MRKGPADEGGVGRGPEAGGLRGQGGNGRRSRVRILPSRGSGPEGVLALRFQQGAFAWSSKPGAVPSPPRVHKNRPLKSYPGPIPDRLSQDR